MGLLAFIVAFLIGCFICSKLEATGKINKMPPLVVGLIGLGVGAVAFVIVSIIFGH